MEINSSPISYQGLNRKLSKNIFYHETVRELDKLYPKSNGIVGNIPPQWIKNMPADKRGTLIPDLYATIGKFVSILLPIIPSDTLRNKTLTYILRKHQAIGPKSSVQIYEVAGGAMSIGYKIENKTDGYSLFLKRFEKNRKNKYLRESGIHGAIPENNIKTFLKHDMKTKREKSQFSNFYYGDIKNKYYIEEYLSKRESISYKSLMPEVRTATKKDIRTTLSEHGLYHSDLHEHNVRYYFDENGKLTAKCFDLGGIDRIDNPICESSYS